MKRTPKMGNKFIDGFNEYYYTHKWLRVTVYSVFGFVAFVFLIAFLATKSADQNAVQPKDIAQTTVVENNKVTEEKIAKVKAQLPIKEKIDDWVFTKYTKSQYPKTFAKFGSRMSDVEKARQAAAFLAITNDQCWYVDMSEVSDSSTRDNIKIFTDCYDKNKEHSERYRFEELELKDSNNKFFTETTAANSGGVKTMLEQSFSKEAALTICQESVRKSAQFPSSVDFSLFGQTVNTSQGTGETWVELEFEAKNGMGAMLPYKANCSFPLHGEPTINITNR